MAPNSPFFDPFLLDVGLMTSRANKHSFFIQHSSLFLHGLLFFLATPEDGILPETIARSKEDDSLSSQRFFPVP
jgi:hypothetical protein